MFLRSFHDIARIQRQQKNPSVNRVIPALPSSSFVNNTNCVLRKPTSVLGLLVPKASRVEKLRIHIVLARPELGIDDKYLLVARLLGGGGAGEGHRLQGAAESGVDDVGF